MAVDSKHPLWGKFAPYWKKMRDTYAGSDAVKEEREEYLPATQGMIRDGMTSPTAKGYLMYEAYLKRAVFHDFVKDAVKIAIGAMYCKAPKIKLPPQMEALRKKATPNGETLDMLLRRINVEQLVTGRLGLFADFPSRPTPDQLPYIVLYEAEHIINWDHGDFDESNLPRLNLVVLCETAFERTDTFDWEQEEKYRVLVLGDPNKNEVAGEPATAFFQVVERGEGGSADYSPTQLKQFLYRGRPLNELPFVIVNAADVVADPDYPALSGLADIALAAYRGEADYRQNLFQQAQDTLVTVGSSEDDHRLGVGASINLKPGGEAYFIGVSSDGLGEMRQALAADKSEAAHRAGQLIDNRTRPFESGEALKVRQSGQSATLTEIAIAGAYGLQTILRTIATWIGADPEQVVVEPNLDFSLTGMMTQELVELMTAKAQGAPLSIKSIHTLCVERGLTRMTFEEELSEIEKDPEFLGTEAAGDNDDPEDDAPSSEETGNDVTGQ